MTVELRGAAKVLDLHEERQVGRTFADCVEENYRRMDERPVVFSLAGLDLVEVDLDSTAVLIGGPGRMKTSIALLIAANHVRHAGPAVIVSVELSGRQLAARMIGTFGGVSWRDALRGAVPRERADELARAMSRMRVLDGDDADLERSRAAVRQMKLQHPGEPLLLVVDYVQILPTAGREVRERVAGAVEAVGRLVRDEQVVGLALSQSSRAGARDLASGEKLGADTIDAGAESSAIEKWASITLALGAMSSPSEDGTCSIELSAGKGRYGDGDKVIALRADGRTGHVRIASDWRAAQEVKSERAGDKDKKKRESAELAMMGAIAKSKAPMTREDLTSAAGCKREVGKAAIAALCDRGELVQVQQRAPRAKAWKLWPAEKARAAGIPLAGEVTNDD